MVGTKTGEQQNLCGVFEKELGSNIWWIRYTDGVGKYKREKVGRRGDAVALYQNRKSEARLGVKMPDNIRHRGVTLKDPADAILIYIGKKDYKDKRNVTARVKRLSKEFGPTEASKLLPEDISAWLPRNTRTPATSNRYKAVFSLIYREGVRNRQVQSNPTRLLAQLVKTMSAFAGYVTMNANAYSQLCGSTIQNILLNWSFRSRPACDWVNSTV